MVVRAVEDVCLSTEKVVYRYDLDLELDLYHVDVFEVYVDFIPFQNKTEDRREVEMDYFSQAN